jgi:hypothetical protein
MMNWSTEPAELPSSDSPLNSQVEDEIEAPASLLTSRSGPFDKVVATDRAPVQEEAPAPQSTSFIDRYSHMFVDDKPPVDAPAAPTLRSTDGEDHRQQPRNSGVANGNVGTPLTGDEEESIEQYMSKLLQRVRGDGPAPAAASQAPPAEQPPISGPLGYEPTPMQARSPMTLSAISLRDSLTADGATPTDGPRRKSSIPAPQTDLEALRALANESARRAISRHSLRKYRRNATTKVIVSTLAAMTSVWLMIESPDLLHWQFLGACGTMVIAAYWTGQTIRALLETLRVTAPDDTEKEIREISAELQARLPIDVVSTDK